MSATHPHELVSAPIVVGIDGSEASDVALQWAAETAGQRQRELLIVHGLDLAAVQTVLGSYEVLIPPVAETLHEHGLDQLAAAERQAHRIDSELTVRTELSPAHPSALLIQRSETAHLTVLGAGRGGELAHIGSTLLAVTAHGHGDIVVVRDTGSEQRTRHNGAVVVGIDDTEVSAPAIAAAFAEASLRGAPLTAVHATTITRHPRAGSTSLLPTRELESAATQLLAEQLAGWQEKYPEVRVTHRVVASSPRNVLAALSSSAQLLVVGTRGRGGFRGLLLGSTSNSLVQHAHCPVLVAHED